MPRRLPLFRGAISGSFAATTVTRGLRGTVKFAGMLRPLRVHCTEGPKGQTRTQPTVDRALVHALGIKTPSANPPILTSRYDVRAVFRLMAFRATKVKTVDKSMSLLLLISFHPFASHAQVKLRCVGNGGGMLRPVVMVAAHPPELRTAAFPLVCFSIVIATSGSAGYAIPS